MITSYNTLAIPTATPETAGAGFVQIRRQEIQGFVIPEAGATAEEAFAALVPSLREVGANIMPTVTATIDIGGSVRHPLDGRDRGLHLDSLPSRPGLPLMLDLLYMEAGEAWASLGSTAPDFLSVYSPNPEPRVDDFHPLLPKGTRELFAERKVDTRVLNTQIYTGLLATRSLLAFVLTGPKPTAHDIISLTPRRTSRLRFADMPAANRRP